MKKFLIFLTVCLFLAACTGAKSSEEDVQTRVAQLLTSFPTPSLMSIQQTPSLLPTTSTVEITPTVQAPIATDTTAPVLPTETQTVMPSGQPTSIAQTPSAATPSITPTFPAGDPRTTLGAATWTDTMTTGGNWPTANDEYSTIAFINGDMVLTGLTDLYAWRLATTPSVTNMYLEMSGKFDACSGADSYGMMFRVPVLAEANQGYFFGITCNGDYFFKIWNGKVSPKGLMTTVIAPKASTAILTGANQTNRIGVLVKGSNFKFYINGTLVHEISDTTYSQGFFGVFVNKEVTDKLTVRIAEMSYWIVQ
jgi:hypothetical protein